MSQKGVAVVAGSPTDGTQTVGISEARALFLDAYIDP